MGLLGKCSKLKLNHTFTFPPILMKLIKMVKAREKNASSNFMRRVDSLEKTPMLGKIEGRRRRR